MGIIAKNDGGGSFTPHPEGQHAVVCVDVHDLGMVETQWGMKHKVDVWWYGGIDKTDDAGNEVTDDDGNPIHLLVRERYTLSLHPESNLRKDLERWRGKRFTAEEERGFDLENLIGVPAFVQIVHNESNGNIYANVESIMKLPKGTDAPDVPADYVRFCDREPEQPETQDAPGEYASQAADPSGVGPGHPDYSDDLPF